MTRKGVVDKCQLFAPLFAFFRKGVFAPVRPPFAFLVATEGRKHKAFGGVRRTGCFVHSAGVLARSVFGVCL